VLDEQTGIEELVGYLTGFCAARSAQREG